MTLDEALNELGLEGEANADAARRAYLRLLKKRKPEVDPEGFMRLRAAYERAKAHFERLEMFRAIEEAATAGPSSADDASGAIRLETPAGVVWVHRSRSEGTAPATYIDPEKPSASNEKSSVEQAPGRVETSDGEVAIDAAPSNADVALTANPPEETTVLPTEPPKRPLEEPSIEALIEQGKFIKAARRMGIAYRAAIGRTTMIGHSVPSPYDAMHILLRLHEKNRVDEARALEKDFADWLESTGESVRVMAGTTGAMWLITRELSAVSKNFPAAVRTGIAKAVMAGDLEDLRRRLSWYQLSNPDKARDAALDLHAHAPTLAGMFGETLAPTKPSPAQRGRGSVWGFGIAVMMVLQVFRFLAGSSSDTTSTYRGQSDSDTNYRPKPRPTVNETVDDTAPNPFAQLLEFDAGFIPDQSKKMPQRPHQEMIKLARRIEKASAQAILIDERWVIQRSASVRVAIETGLCGWATSDVSAFYKDILKLSNPLRASILTDAMLLDKLFRETCQLEESGGSPRDGATKKKP